MSKSFWVVWNEQGRTPTFKHTTKQSAETEAERLARYQPGHRFHVLEWIGTCSTQTVIWDRVDEMERELPF